MGARSNQVRIIGGRWRGRKLRFPDVDGLRPTSDRMRETLFNWLMPVLSGARCLDLFAGSGALGFEAASRGAAHVVMVERDPRVLRALRENRRALAADQVEVIEGKAQDRLAGYPGQFDVVFLDPPFSEPLLLGQAIELLVAGKRLKDDACIYVELPAGHALAVVPAGWELYREKRAGGVSYLLYRFQRQAIRVPAL